MGKPHQHVDVPPVSGILGGWKMMVFHDLLEKMMFPWGDGTKQYVRCTCKGLVRKCWENPTKFDGLPSKMTPVDGTVSKCWENTLELMVYHPFPHENCKIVEHPPFEGKSIMLHAKKLNPPGATAQNKPLPAFTRTFK